MTTITIPVTKTEKARYERRARKFGYALNDFSRLAMKTFVPEPTEEEIFTDEALASIRRAEEDIAKGRFYSIRRLKNL